MKYQALILFILSGTATAADTKASKQSTGTSTSRERIAEYVRGGQIFYIKDGQLAMFEEPWIPYVQVTDIIWFCQPKTGSGDEDGYYDNVVSHAITYRPPSTVQVVKDSGANNVMAISTHGYTASWMEELGVYNEVMADFGDGTIHQFNGKGYIAYETSHPGATNGFVSCE